jgi:hypothetical protein
VSTNRKHTGRAGRKASRRSAPVTAHIVPLRNHGNGKTASAIQNKKDRAARPMKGRRVA